MKDKIITWGVVIGLLGWLGNTLYDSIQDRINDNQDTINELVGIHMKGE